ncbi:MAG TPA: BON domain-containing protein [Candidatus Binatia bacterium]|nr:BON domain-containing protein [Candidatus Binatia bacterium]
MNGGLRLLALALILGGCTLVTGKPIDQWVNDVTMTATVKSRLARTEGLGSLTGIHVRTDNDMVYLTGSVTDAATKQRIDRLVRGIAGANRVRNELTVASEAQQASRH